MICISLRNCSPGLFVFSTNRKSQLLTLKQGMRWLDVSIVYFHFVVLKMSVYGILT